jgi:hypothetical protein
VLEVLHRELVGVVSPEVVEEDAHVGGVGERVQAAVAEEEREVRRDVGHVVRRRLGPPVAGDVPGRQHVVVLLQNSVAHRCIPIRVRTNGTGYSGKYYAIVAFQRRKGSYFERSGPWFSWRLAGARTGGSRRWPNCSGSSFSLTKRAHG